jgi:opacity protein-like surface antigen
MKRISTLVLISLFAVAFAFAPAVSAGPVGTLELNAGYAKSSTEVTPNNVAMGGGIGFGASYWKGVSPSVSWGGEVSFDNLGSAEYTDALSSSTTKYSSTVFRVNPAVRYTFGPGVGTSFYAQGGAGWYNVSGKVEDSVAGNVDGSSSKIGFNVGAGVNFPVAPTTKMNVGVQYHTISTEGQSTNYLNFRAGVGFNL